MGSVNLLDSNIANEQIKKASSERFLDKKLHFLTFAEHFVCVKCKERASFKQHRRNYSK